MINVANLERALELILSNRHGVEVKVRLSEPGGTTNEKKKIGVVDMVSANDYRIDNRVNSLSSGMG